MFGIEEMSDKDLSFLEGIDKHLVDDKESLILAEERLKDLEILSLDTETEGLSPLHHNIVGVILAPSKTEMYYFPLAHRVGKNLPLEEFLFFFKKLVTNTKFILANAKFDWKTIFHHWGIDFEIFADVLIQAYILDSDRAESKSLNLKNLETDFLGYTPLELGDFGETNFSFYDPKEALKYVAPDGTSPWALYEIFSKQIKEKKLERVEQIEYSIIKVIGKMELTGIQIDTKVLQDQQGQMKQRVDYLEKKIHTLAGHPFDVNSSQQMAVVLYDELKIPPLTKGGQPDRSVGVNNLEALEKKHPIIKAIMNYRDVTKLYNDFVLKLPGCLAEDSRLHGEFNQTGTRSGRFSASGGFGRGGQKIKVNLQQLPKAKAFEDEIKIKIPPQYAQNITPGGVYSEDEIKKMFPDWKEAQEIALDSWEEATVTQEIPVKIRDALIPSPGYIWISADYSQLEYRTLANLAEDENLIDAFRKGIDFHTATASDMLKVPIDKVTKAQRKTGKTINFGIVYGMTKYGLSEKLGNTPDEAQDLMNLYFKNKPKVLALVDKVKKSTKANKFVRTYFGRIRWFKTQLVKASSFHAEDQILKQSFNTYIQGSAADMAKIALARAAEAVKPYGDKIRILSQVHDEINFEVHKSIPLEEAILLIDKAMSFRGIFPNWADIPADIEIGECYGQLKSPEDYGVNMKELLANVTKTEVDPALFAPQDYTPSAVSSFADTSRYSRGKKAETSIVQPKQFTTRETIVKPVVSEKKDKSIIIPPSTVSKGQQMMQKRQEVKEVASLDLSKAKFAVSTIVIKKKEVDDDTAFNLLKKFVAENFGTYDLLIENDGMLYKFPENYRVNQNVEQLEEAFEVRVFTVRPKVKLTL